MELDFARVLRTSSSERFLLRSRGADFAALDLHYLPDQKVSATLVVFEEGHVTESQVPELLREIDLKLLPDVSLEEKNLVFTVVFGRVMGAYAAELEESKEA